MEGGVSIFLPTIYVQMHTCTWEKKDDDQKNTFLFDKSLHLLSNLIIPPSDSNMECIITTNCNESGKLYFKTFDSM